MRENCARRRLPVWLDGAFSLTPSRFPLPFRHRGAFIRRSRLDLRVDATGIIRSSSSSSGGSGSLAADLEEPVLSIRVIDLRSISRHFPHSILSFRPRYALFCHT